MIEETALLSWVSLAFSTLVMFLWKEERANVKMLLKAHYNNEEDHKEIGSIKDRSNQAYIEFALSNQALVSEIKKLDRDVRHEIKDMGNIVNGFGARLKAIEEDVTDRVKENTELSQRISAVEKVVFKKD